MSIFGWSYPPGAANDPNAPWNQGDGPCDVCGEPVDACICPECPVCGAQGDPACYVERECPRVAARVSCGECGYPLCEAREDQSQRPDLCHQQGHGLVRTVEQDHGAALLEESERQQCAAEVAYGDDWSER
jgi:hypothetical protein